MFWKILKDRIKLECSILPVCIYYQSGAKMSEQMYILCLENSEATALNKAAVTVE